MRDAGPDALVTKLAEILARKAWEAKQADEAEPSTGSTEWLDFDADLGSHRDYLIREQRSAARAVLASGLVVPAPEVWELGAEYLDGGVECIVPGDGSQYGARRTGRTFRRRPAGPWELVP